VKWLEYQDQHLWIHKKPFTNSNHGPLWLSTLIIRIWNHCHVWELHFAGVGKVVFCWPQYI
jgi:hypothetical protein